MVPPTFTQEENESEGKYFYYFLPDLLYNSSCILAWESLCLSCRRQWEKREKIKDLFGPLLFGVFVFFVVSYRGLGTVLVTVKETAYQDDLLILAFKCYAWATFAFFGGAKFVNHCQLGV